MERGPSFESNALPVPAVTQIARQLLDAAEDMPTPIRPPLEEEPGFVTRWRSILADSDEQISIGLAVPEREINRLPHSRRDPHIILVRRLEETADRSGSIESYMFFENKITRPVTDPRESAFVHPSLNPVPWARMKNLLLDAQSTLAQLGKFGEL